VNTGSVTVSTVVAVDPVTAFDLFTSEIGAWWKPKRNSLFQNGRSGSLTFQDGRVLEIYGSGEPFEVGRVLAWEPPTRLLFEWRHEGFAPGERTEVEVRFEPAPAGTRVTVEHRGWDALAPNHPARHGFTGTAFTGMIGLCWADALTNLRAAALRTR
jgi:uncharacterized protein YndB with AHSA1/START domain